VDIDRIRGQAARDLERHFDAAARFSEQRERLPGTRGERCRSTKSAENAALLRSIHPEYRPVLPDGGMDVLRIRTSTTVRLKSSSGRMSSTTLLASATRR
jgi:hypothetical protein